MSYIITRTNGTVLGTISDGTYNNTATSLTLVGRNYSNYGQIMTNTLVRLLENSSYSISPSYPLSGQLWWDSGNNYLKVYTGSTWKIVSSCTAQAAAPSTTTAGDLWWDTTNQQLYVYNGTSPYSADGWILVGPGYPTGHKTGAIVEAITDTLASTHYVTSLYADETRIAIISKDTQFTPSPSLAGFTTIQTGMNMASGDIVWGTANNASYLGTQPAANYFRNNIDNVGTGSLTLQSNAGITLGSVGNFTANIYQASGSARLYNTLPTANISLWVNTGSSVVKSLAADGRDGLVYVTADPTGALGVATKQYVDNSFINANLWGISTAITAPQGTSNTMIATTEFVASGLSGIFKYKIYSGAVGTNHMWIDSTVPAANLVIGSQLIMQASSTGVDLKSGATAVTMPQTYTGAGNATIATTQYVKTAQQWWGTGANASAKFVSTSAPSAGINDGGSNNGDFWFQIAS
jgi:hypothetical protein